MQSHTATSKLIDCNKMFACLSAANDISDITEWAPHFR